MEIIAIALALRIVGYAYKGWVLSLLWSWFVVGTFNAPAIGIAQAIGLSIIVGTLTNHSTDTSNKTEVEKWSLAIFHFLAIPTLSLIVGFIASLFL